MPNLGPEDAISKYAVGWLQNFAILLYISAKFRKTFAKFRMCPEISRDSYEISRNIYEISYRESRACIIKTKYDLTYYSRREGRSIFLFLSGQI
jgi:hypothetical protein